MCWRSKNTRKSGNSPPPTESTSAHNFKTITPNSDVSLLLTAMMVALVTILPRLLRFLHLHRTLPLTLAHSCTTWCDRGAESKWKKKLPASHFLSLACGAKIAPVLRLWSPRKKTPFEPKKKNHCTVLLLLALGIRISTRNSCSNPSNSTTVRKRATLRQSRIWASKKLVRILAPC